MASDAVAADTAQGLANSHVGGQVLLPFLAAGPVGAQSSYVTPELVGEAQALRGTEAAQPLDPILRPHPLCSIVSHSRGHQVLRGRSHLLMLPGTLSPRLRPNGPQNPGRSSTYDTGQRNPGGGFRAGFA